MLKPAKYHGVDYFPPGELIFINRIYEPVFAHLHFHDFIEIAYVVSGRGVHHIGEVEYTVTKGDLFIINYDVPHEFRSLADTNEPPLYVYNCIFLPGFLDAALINARDFSQITHHFLFRSFFPEEHEEQADIKIMAQDNQQIEDIFAKMHHEFQIKDSGYIEILRAYLIELLVLIFRLCRRQNELTNRIEMQRHRIIQEVIKYVKANYAHEIKLDELSMKAFLSRNYFCKLFKDCTGMTVSEFVQKIRIDEACRLLKETDLKVIDVAYEVGYRDLKFFHQVFKRITGKTPGEYRT